MKIDGYDGIDVYQRADLLWYAEHFRNPPGRALRVIWRSRGYDTRIEAEVAQRKYRAQMADS